MKNMYICSTVIGDIAIVEEGKTITALLLPGENPPDDATIAETPLLRSAGQQLHEYLAGERESFDLPLKSKGTDFQQAVWSALQHIPYGATRSYKSIAESIGRPRAYRAVGQACNRNPIPIFIPCHRVVGADGRLVGFGGGLTVKAFLLDLEKRHR